MSKSSNLGGIVIVVLVGNAIGQDRQEAIDLGGPRQAKAYLTVSESDYVVKVRMLPVSSFDEATNARLNRDKGRQLALWALAKHLSEKDSVEVYVSGAQIEKVGTDDKFYTLTLRVPRKGVALVRAGEKPAGMTKKGLNRVPVSSALFTRKQDYLDTLNNLTTSVLADLNAIEEKAKDKTDDPKELSAALGQIEKDWANNVATIRQEIKADLLLFAMEQEELNQAIDKENRRVLTCIQETVKKQTAEEEKEKSP